MRVAVTGGAGYIGSVITDALIDRDHEVLVIDNLSKGHRDAVSERAAFKQLDLAATSQVRDALKSFAADAVIHMAASSLVGESVSAPAAYYQNNAIGSLSLLEAMRAAGVSRLIFSSTAAVYGEPEKQPIEETDRTQPSNPYGETKLAIEQALRWYSRAYDLRSVSLRYFNAAGASAQRGERHEPETHLIPLVLQAAAGQRPHVAIFGDDYPTRDGTCVRDYIHVEDLADAHIRALDALDESCACLRFNLGCGGDGYSVRDIIRVARAVTARDIPTITQPRRPGDPAVLIANADRIFDALAWRPQRSLHEMVQSAWSWMQHARDERTTLKKHATLNANP